MGIKKILGIALTTVGAAGTIAGTALLPVGCLKEYKIEVKAPDADYKMATYIGVGSSNYGGMRIKLSGSDVTDEMKTSIEDLNKEYKKVAKELRKETKYSDFVDESKKILDNWDAFKALVGNNAPEGFENIDQMKEMLESVISANSTMIAGAVLLPVFAVIMIIGIVLVVLGKNKKAKVAE